MLKKNQKKNSKKKINFFFKKMTRHTVFAWGLQTPAQFTPGLVLFPNIILFFDTGKKNSGKFAVALMSSISKCVNIV